MSTNTSIKSHTTDKKITYFGLVRIDDLFIGVEKDESCGFTGYYITVSPKQNGSSSGVVKSAGCAITSDDDALKFIERLKDILKLIIF